MDLGYKTLNILTSKDFIKQKEAASLIINTKDIKAFEILCEKSEFLFDFIKEKINKNLAQAINNQNVLNLFDFIKIYSDDYKDFIIESFYKFNSNEIEKRMSDIIKYGSDNEKTYATLYFKKIKNDKILEYVKDNIKSDFDYLKKASIEFLKEFNIKDEFYNAIQTLNSDKSEFDKMEAVEFLSYYKDNESFDAIYNYFKTVNNEFLAFSLLSIKDIDELVKENKEEEILNILSVLFYNFPHTTLFEDISCYLDNKLFDFLMESENIYSCILMYYIKNKLSFLINNEEYAIDLDKNSKKEVENLIKNLEYFIPDFDKNEAIEIIFNKNIKIQTLISLELSDKEEGNLIKNLIKNSKDNEIIYYGIKTLKRINSLDNTFLEEIKNNITNETIKLELQNYCSCSSALSTLG